MVEHEYQYKPKVQKTEFTQKLRVINKKYGSLGVTIPKEIVNSIDLSDKDSLNFKLLQKNDNNVIIDIQFMKEN